MTNNLIIYFILQDKTDDVIVGVKSTALLFKENTPLWLSLFSVSMVSLMTISGYMAEQTYPYYLALGGVATHLSWQVKKILVTILFFG